MIPIHKSKSIKTIPRGKNCRRSRIAKPAVVLMLAALISAVIVQSVSAARVYLVIGSDTAIWSGMNTGRFNCTYDQSLYTDPLRNGYIVMNPAFRSDLRDSFDQLKGCFFVNKGFCVTAKLDQVN